MAADTGRWLMPVQYERTARAEGNTQALMEDVTGEMENVFLKTPTDTHQLKEQKAKSRKPKAF